MFNNNKVNMIISLLCAIALWFYVVGQVDPKTEKKFGDVPIEFINEDSLTDNGLAVSDIDFDTATVTLEGNRADLNRIDKDNIRVTADLRDLPKGTNTVTLKATVPKEAELVSTAPETIDVVIEDRVTESKPVELKFKGEAEEGMEPGDFHISPDNIQVAGARSQVDKVEAVVATIDLSKINETGSEFNVKAVPVNKKGKRVRNVTMSTRMVNVECKMLTTKEVDLNVETVGEVADDIQVDEIQIPEKVVIRGEKGYLDEVDSIDAADVDISSVKETTELPIEVYLPYGVELADESEDISVKVVIKDLASQEFEISSSSVSLNNIADGLSGTMEEKTLKVTVKAADSVLESLTAEDITLSADLSGLEAGTHSVKIKAECAKDVSSIEVMPDRGEITIREKE